MAPLRFSSPSRDSLDWPFEQGIGIAGDSPPADVNACAETAQSTISELRFLVGNVTAGHFVEEVDLPSLDGSAWLSTEVGRRGRGTWTGHRARIRLADAASMLTGRRRYAWEPWPARRRDE
jgi:hypothetical protein